LTIPVHPVLPGDTNDAGATTALTLRVPVLGLYGEKDGGIPLDTLDKMKMVLASGTAAAQAAQFVVYPDAPHAFHADYRPSYRQGPAEDGWQRCLAWLKAHGVA
jgi:carboxymethylenebutenolidase